MCELLSPLFRTTGRLFTIVGNGPEGSISNHCMETILNQIDSSADERWDRFEEQLKRGIFFFGAIFIAIGLGELLFVAIDRPELTYGPGGSSSWTPLLGLAFAVYFAIRLHSPGLKVAAIVFAVSVALGFLKVVLGPGLALWIVKNFYLVVMGFIFVVVGKENNGRKARIVALFVCLGLFAAKYAVMVNVVKAFGKYQIQ